MSSLAVAVDGQSSAEALEWVTAGLLHRMPGRSPDGRFFARLPGVSLAVGLRATTLEQASLRPFVHAPSGVAVVADLLLFPGTAAGRSDRDEAVGNPAGALVEAYLRSGPEFVADLVGNFALVLWDPRRGQLVAARDPFGVRSLYFWSRGATMALASDVGALCGLPGFDPALDDETVLEHLSSRYRQFRGTFFRDVTAVQAGHYALWRPGGTVEQRRFFVPRPPRSSLRTVDDAVEGFRALFLRVVEDHLRVEGPVVVELSGGLDSSSIACAAPAVLPHGSAARVRLATASFPGLDCDETGFADLVARGLPFAHSTWSGLESDQADLHEDQIFRGWPFGMTSIGDGASGDTRLAQSLGARVVISGEGGNQIAWEDGYLQDALASREKWRFFLPALTGDWSLAGLPSPDHRRAVKHDLLTAVVPERLRRWRREAKSSGRTPPAPGWAGPRLAARWHDSPAGWRQQETARRQAGEALGSHMQRAIWHELTKARVTWILGYQELRLGSEGIEGRYPFLDVRLAEFVMSIPPHLRPLRTGGRALQRYAMRGILPKAILMRRGGASFDVANVYHARAAAPAIERVLRQGPWRSAEYVHRDKIQRMFETLRARALRASDSRDWTIVRNAASLEVWLRRIFG
jgi:asparagine synthase (glutamine-hydrolysing)